MMRMTEGERKANPVTDDLANCQGFLATTVLERFSTIKIYHAQNLVTEKFNAILDRLEINRAHLSHYVHWTCGNASRQMTVMYVIAGVIVVILHRKGLIGLLTDLAVVGYYARTLVDSFQSSHNLITKSTIALSRVLPFCKLILNAEFDQEREKEFKTNENISTSSSSSKLRVEINDLGATYSISASNINNNSNNENTESKKALPGLYSCTLKPIQEKDIILLRSPNGQGKSTLLKVMASLLRPNKGTLKMQNVKVAMLNQEPVLLGGCTIAENICMMSLSSLTNNKEEKEKIMEKVIDAAKRAVCYNVIMNLQNGFETVIDGTGSISGSPLSGGNLQRCCVARMFFSEANLLLLDEPTNNLDAESADIILKTVIEEECHKRKCAAVIATHEMKYFVDHGEKVRIVKISHGVCNEE